MSDHEEPIDAAYAEPSSYAGSRLRARLIGETATVVFIAMLTQAAGVTGLTYLLFPEMGALAHDIFSRPNGKWARAPVMLVLTPFLSALAGTLVTRGLPYGPAAILLCVAAAVLIVQGLRSPVAPAISAGLLPLSLGVRSWWYPAAILLATALLAGASFLHRALRPAAASLPVTARDRQDDEVEEPAGRYSWIGPYFVFVGVAAALVHLTGWRFVLFPPLAVIAFEMFAHPRVCPWASRPFALVSTCAMSALCGWAVAAWLGTGTWAAAAATVLGIISLLLLDLRAPPALSVALLPFVMERPDPYFPVEVTLGVVVLSLMFQLSKWLATLRT